MPLSDHEGDLDIYSEITVTGDVSGQITVRSGGVLVLLGVAEGGVVVTGGGFARIAGTTKKDFTSPKQPIIGVAACAPAIRECGCQGMRGRTRRDRSSGCRRTYNGW